MYRRSISIYTYTLRAYECNAVRVPAYSTKSNVRRNTHGKSNKTIIRADPLM